MTSFLSYRNRIQYANLSGTSSITWTIQKPIESHSKILKPTKVSSDTHKNPSFKTTSYGFESTKAKELQELFSLYQKFFVTRLFKRHMDNS
jgi:hypothetical protein